MRQSVMRIIERVERTGPDRQPWSPPPVKLAVSAFILVIGLTVAGFVAPSEGLMLASFGLAWTTQLALMLFGAAFALEERRRRSRGPG